MEKIPEPKHCAEALRERGENIEEFVEKIVHQKDTQSSYHCLVLLYPELTDAQRDRLVLLICSDQSGAGEEEAFNVLHEVRGLGEGYRKSLLEYIVTRGDKTVCSETLLFIQNLGEWEQKLRNVLLASPPKTI